MHFIELIASPVSPSRSSLQWETEYTAGRQFLCIVTVQELPQLALPVLFKSLHDNFPTLPYPNCSCLLLVSVQVGKQVALESLLPQHGEAPADMILPVVKALMLDSSSLISFQGFLLQSPRPQRTIQGCCVDDALCLSLVWLNFISK